MLSIQETGLSILGDSPKNFYILGGSEYGIKERYIEILESKIGSKIEYDKVTDVITMMSKYHIIPLEPHVYVIRYDKDFLTQAKDMVGRLQSLEIIGTIVLVYEDPKDLAKLDKVFPDSTSSIDPIDAKHMAKYLTADFEGINPQIVKNVTKHVHNYYQAKNICRCLYAIQDTTLLTEKQILSLFGLQLNYTEEDLQVAIASRNFNAITYITDHYDGDVFGILYQILRVMIELDKIKSSRYSNSPLRDYARKWTVADIYWMFNHTYDAIKSLREGYTVDVSDVITYLGALMVFKNVPDKGLLK